MPRLKSLRTATTRSRRSTTGSTALSSSISVEPSTPASTSPDHPDADKNGMRGDVAQLVRDLKIPYGPLSRRQLRLRL